jgi:aminocarboxymuconate-semialdehyde decarboxylase
MMRLQREYFQDEISPMADVVFVGCCVTNAAEPRLPTGGAAPRRRVVLGGRRVKTVDVHAHCAVPEAMALMGSKVSPEALLMVQEPLRERLRAMDAQGIDVEALSINPYWYTAERDLARQLIRVQNEKLAELCAAQPDRFVAFATVALQYPDLAVEQLEDGIKRLGLCGVSIGGSVNGEELSDPKFHPFWAKAEELVSWYSCIPRVSQSSRDVSRATAC